MTDALELLKKDWQKKNDVLPKLSYEQLHSLIWKKSSSVVRWILIVSILEFTLPHLLLLLPPMEKAMEIYEHLGVANYLFALSLLMYAVAIYFIVQFYMRFREISVLDTAKALMNKIIRTRKTVKHYVIFSLAMIVVNIIITLIGIYLTEDIAQAFPEIQERLQAVSPEKLRTTLMLTVGIFGLVLTAVVGCIYFLLYGLLLKKLKRNYTELQQLEL